jgi:hypothetical protein
MSSFTENLYLKKAIQQLQEENTRLKQVLREYEFDSEMATAEIEPFDPKNPRARRQSIGSRAADILHDHALEAYSRGFIHPPKHPNEMDEGELIRHTDKLLRVTPTEHHQALLGVVGHVIAQHPQWNLDLQNMGGVANQRGAAYEYLSPHNNLARLRMLQGFGLA